MIKHKHNIIWEKWEDPFELKEEYGNDLENDVTEEEYNQLVSEIEKSYQEQEQQQQEQQSQQYRFILTPFGAVSPDQISLGKNFKFWIGHTNFNITSAVSGLIENTEGVEILDIYTRYRFRIAVGYSFTDREVMSAIQKIINKEVQPIVK